MADGIKIEEMTIINGIINIIIFICGWLLSNSLTIYF